MDPVPNDEPGVGPLFRLEGVGFGVDTTMLLEGVGLKLEAGRVYALIGHNGSGKSTLLRVLARQQSPTVGQVRYRERPIGEWSAVAFAREVGYLAQTPPAAVGLTVAELAALGRYPWLGALRRPRRRDREKTAEALTVTGMERFADRSVASLSGGEAQRAWLAMLVAQETRCMLLDEPISALDIAHQMEIMALIRRLCHERGLTIVVVLHDVNVAARFCDELIALRQGRLLTRGAPREVVQPSVLERIYGVPMGVLQHPERAVPISYVG
ncbi:ATP-binding cassette domain-containing protein [Arhodomonas sp. SL1]|uniref:ATP-binding cassette domain-containing protein n=1 Tax=Arhodomonas sp. SL1 TaxID=3425691 RepID=UPI003F884C16